MIIIKNLSFLICFLILVSCQFDQRNKDGNSDFTELKGDLYFKAISLGSFYETPDSSIQKFISIIDELKNLKRKKEEEEELIEMFEVLKENDLIHRPYFHLKVDSNEILTVYVNEQDYGKIEQFNWSELTDENKKVTVSLEGKIIREGIVKCEKIISVEKVDGKTEWKK